MSEDQRRDSEWGVWWLLVIEGYNACLIGVRKTECPYDDPQEQIAWTHGWRSRAWAALEERTERLERWQP